MNGARRVLSATVAALTRAELQQLLDAWVAAQNAGDFAAVGASGVSLLEQVPSLYGGCGC